MNRETYVAAVICTVIFVILLNIGLFCLLGLVAAYLWNTFIASPVIAWWQAALVFVVVRFLLGTVRR